jgi:hypothetical protein
MPDLATPDIAPGDVQHGLLDLAAMRLEALLSEPDAATTSTLDSLMRRLFDPRDRELLTVSAFASSL